MCGQVPTKTCHESYHEFVDQMKFNLEVVHEKRYWQTKTSNKNTTQKPNKTCTHRNNMFGLRQKQEPKEDVQNYID